MRSIPVEELQPGMILARSIINDEMMVILSEGTLLSKAHITRLAFLDIPIVYIKDEYELSEAFQNVSALFDTGSAFVSEYKDVIHTAKSIFDEAKNSGKAPIQKSQEVIKDTIAPMAKEMGIKCEVSLENKMACGLGACLCCVEKTLDKGNVCVCTEGPVINAERLEW